MGDQKKESSSAKVDGTPVGTPAGRAEIEETNVQSSSDTSTNTADGTPKTSPAG
jgi:hypothetical protein